MGDEQKEKELRQVNIETGPVTAVSEYMNIMSTGLKYMEDVDKDVSTPVMKKVEELDEITTTELEESKVIEAHEAVGLKLAQNSKKHPLRVKRAKEKRKTQVKIFQMRKDYDDAESKKAKPTEEELKQRQEKVYEKLQDPEALKTLMFEKSGDTGDEKLINKYKDIRNFISSISDYEAELKSRKEKQNPTEEEKKALIAAEARLKTLYDMRAYYEVNEKIMRNKYYSLLPRKEMRSLSFEELRSRLAVLYDKDQADRNQDLIDFYQNLIRLKEIGIKDVKSVTTREQEYLGAISKEKAEDKTDHKKEMENMASLYSDMLSSFNGDDLLLTVEGAILQKQRFFNVYADRIEKYKDSVASTKKKNILSLIKDYEDYKKKSFEVADDRYEFFKDRVPKNEGMVEKAGNEKGGIEFTPAQKQGAKDIQAYLMKRAIDKGRYSFVNRILDADFKQQMLIFYLVENEKEESPVTQDCFTALYNYQPDYANFEKKSNWKKISRAVRTSTALFSGMKAIDETELAISEVSERIKKDKEDEESKKTEGVRNTVDKIKDVVSAIVAKGKMLRILYKAGGLHEDMPPDMAEDPVLRQRLFKEYRESAELVLRLRTLSGTDKIAKDDYGNKGPLSKAEAKDDDGEAVFDKSAEVIDKINEYGFTYGQETIGGIIESLGEVSKGLTETNAFQWISGGLGGLAAFFGFVGAVMTATNIAVDNTMSTADRWGQSLSVSSDFVGVVGTTLSAVSTIGGIFTTAEETVSEGGKWLAAATDTFFTTTTAMDKVAIAGGAFAIGAGAVKVVAGSVQLGRAISSHLDISRSKDALAEKEKNGALSEDEEKLKKFLSHQKFETIRKDVSSGVSIAAGTLAIVAGGLAMSVHLAPIGALVGLTALGLEAGAKFISWRAKKKHWKNRVDDLLGVDNLVAEALAHHPNAANLKEADKSDLREKMREEALAMLGFSSYEECFRHICTEYAELLYKKVFIEDPPPADREMYLDAMKSLGLKFREPKVQGERPKPSIAAMVSKMMG